MENRGAPWTTVEHRTAPWRTVEHRGAPWSSVEQLSEEGLVGMDLDMGRKTACFVWASWIEIKLDTTFCKTEIYLQINPINMFIL